MRRKHSVKNAPTHWLAEAARTNQLEELEAELLIGRLADSLLAGVAT